MSRMPESRRSALQASAPLLNLGAAWAVRSVMIRVYEARTGKQAPLVHTRNGSLLATVAWAASVAAAMALVEGLIIRALSDDGD